MSPGRASRDDSNHSPYRDNSPAKVSEFSGGTGPGTQSHRFVITRPRGRPPVKRKIKIRTKKAFDVQVPQEQGLNKRHQQRELSPGSTGSNRTKDTGQTDNYTWSHDTYSLDFEEDNDENASPQNQSTRRRPAWNSSVVVAAGIPPPPQRSTKRYEKELTFRPTITTKQEVITAYTDRQPGLVDEDEVVVSEDEGIMSPLYSEDEMSGDSRSSESPGRNKDRMLSKREARAYIKMNAVYGSDAYKNQRKQWFIEKLSKAQDKKAKVEEEKRKAEEKKREEDRKKQQRQLDYVRKKFRKEQVHRFRTQYVTSRVLEHEHANRHEYGLPEDYDDGTKSKGSQENVEHPQNGQVLDGDEPSQLSGADEITSSPNQPHYLKTQNNRKANGHANDKPTQPHKYNNRINQRGDRNVGDSKAQNGQETREERLRRESEEERQRQRQEQQKSWYAAYERKSGPKRDSKLQTVPSDSAIKGRTGNYPNRRLDTEKSRGSKAQQIAPNKGTLSKNAMNHNPKVTKVNGNELDDVEQDSPIPRLSSVSINSIKDTGHYDKETKDRTGSDTKGADETNEASHKRIAGHPHDKYVGPALPHTKSHANPADKEKEKKGNVPLIIHGHFRQEDDGGYHLVDDSKTTSKVRVEDENNTDKVVSSSKRNSKDVVSVLDESNKIPPPELSRKSPAKQNKLQAGNRPTKDEDKKETKKPAKPEKLSVLGFFDEPNSLSTKQEAKVQRSGADVNAKDNSKKPSNSKTQDKAIKESDYPNLMAFAKENTDVQSASNKLKASPNNAQSKTKGKGSSSPVPSQTVITPSPSQADKNQRVTVLNSSTTQNPAGPNKVSNSNLDTSSSKPDKRRSNSINTKPQPQRIHPRGAEIDNSHPGPGGQAAPRQTTASSGQGTTAKKKKVHGNKALANMFFDVNMGPSWDASQKKVPKMEGIDTVVIETKNSKGQVIKQKKEVKDVVKDAENILSKTAEGASIKKSASKPSRIREASPDVTLGSDFDVDDDEEEEELDIFERLRKKYNIKIDSDEEDL